MAKQKKAAKKITALLALSISLAVGTTSLGASLLTFAEEASKPYAGKYYTDFDSMEEAKTAAEDLTRELAQEGDVLLKNKDNALPLSGKEWVSVFGVTSDNLIGASDSAGAFSGGSTGSDTTVPDALEAAGFKVNPTLKAYYKNDTSEHGDEDTTFNGQVRNSFSLYNDVAFIVLSREGGEGSDASRVTDETVKGSEDDHKALLKKETSEGEQGGPKAAEDEYYKHSLMLTNSEEELIDMVKTQFKKVVVITNTSNPMEIDDLKNDDEIDGIIHIGRPGVGGLDGLADILIGKVSPSGGLVDEWAADFTADPTWYNFGNNNQTAGYNGTGAGSSKYKHENGSVTGTTGTSTAYEGSEGYFGIDYEEGIYLGYKYYETVYTEIAEGYLTYTDGELAKPAQKNTEGAVEQANAWWDDYVTYQYGYGLSYTSFSFNVKGLYTDKDCKTELGANVNADQFNSSVGNKAPVDKLYVPVEVKNTGNYAGKKTVQVYVTAPYIREANSVEKSAVVLVGFAKTDELKPGETQTVTVEFNVQDMASWDSNADNGDGTKGHYILDAGEYIVRAMEDSHYDYATEVEDDKDAYDEARFQLNGKADLKIDDFSGNAVKDLFTTEVNDVSKGDQVKVDDLNYGNVRTADMMAEGGTGMTVLSRADMVGTFPEAPTEKDLVIKEEVLANWAFWDNFTVSNKCVDGNGNPTADGGKTYYNRENPGETVYDAQKNYVSDKKGDPWYKEKKDIPEGWTQAAGVYDEDHMVQNNRTELLFPMYVSLAENSPIKYKDMRGVAWDDPQWDKFLNQLTYDELCTVVEFGGYSTVDIASVGKVKTEDSDGPNNWDSSHCWCSEDIIASTFNVELAEKQGRIMGNIGLLKSTSGTQTGWYGPGADIHRSPFSGRNNEYYSQDSLHSGYMAAAVIKGVQSKGIVCYVKHCFMNDQESNRGNLFTWATEQSMRETYTKSFQMALQEGGSKGAMVGYGRIGGLSNTNNYNLNTELYQNQWGSHASFVTDGYIGWKVRTDPDMMVRAGNVFELYTTPFVEYLSGEWDAEKGTVMVDGANGEKVESYTQWYCVRMAAKSVLYNTASTVGQRNGYSEMAITGSALTSGMESVKYEASVGIASLLDADSTAKMTVTAGKLPEGLSLNELTGDISGTPKETGDFKFTVGYIIDGFISKSAEYSIKIESALALDEGSDALDEMKVGQDFMAVITSSEFTTDKYDKLTYAVKSGKLPAGLTLTTDKGEAIIEGTPTEAGTYTAVIELTAEKSGGGGGGKPGSKNGIMTMGTGGPGGNKGGSTTETTKVEIELTFVVASDGQTTPEPEWEENVPYIGANGNWFVNGEDKGIAAQGPAGEDGETPYIGENGNWWIGETDLKVPAQGEAGPAGPQGPAGETGPQGPAGQDGKDGKDGSGCNSSVSGIAGLTFVALAAAGTVYLLKKKKEN